jgi:hypothetical protein
VELAGDVLLAKTAQTLYALDPASGKVRWEFCPRGCEGETLYSEPSLDGRRLFIGDREGWFYCLDVETGQTIWKQETSSACNRDVNATATVVAVLVITATNAGLALAYCAETGRPVWQFHLDGSCTNHLFLADNQVVVATDSLYFLAPTTGELLGRVQWPGLRVAFAAGTASEVALIRQPSWDEWRKSSEDADVPDPKADIMLVLEGTRLIREINCSPYSRAVRFSAATGLLYASGLWGLDILNPAAGEWQCALRDTGRTGGYGLPDVTENRIYTIDGEGVVRAVHHPAVRC